MDIVLPQPLADELRAKLLGHANEQCAVLFTTVARGERSTRLLVREAYWPEPSDYVVQTPLSCELKADCVAKVSKQARKRGEGMVFVHTHPDTAGVPEFSTTDDQGEALLREFAYRRNPDLIHAALVLSAGGMRARVLGAGEPLRIAEVGASLTFTALTANGADEPSEARFDRQVRAFGADGQRALEQLRVGVVGLGGTGSLVVQQLVHLGVRKLLLIDPDTIEETNLNRVAGATPQDIGAAKVDVAKRLALSVLPDAQVDTDRGNITRLRAATLLKDVDFLFGCTDSHGSRAVLQQVAYQYLIPCIDLGVVIATHGLKVRHVGARIQLLAPGEGCFSCGGLLSPDAVRRDMMSEEELAADPYFIGRGEPAPAVMPLNGIVTSLGATMFMAMVTGAPMAARHLQYDQVRTRLRSVHTPSLAGCPICSDRGCFAAGDTWPLSVRQD